MSQISEYRILTIQDFSNLLCVGQTQAKRYKKDIQDHFKIKFVLFKHFQAYFKTDKDTLGHKGTVS